MAGTADVVVVGAGPAGLAAAAAARSSGLEVEILEAADSVGTSWRHHYDRLHLHTTRRLSGLPGLPIPPRAGRWVSRDNFVAYLEEYARQMRLQIHFQTQVSHVEREGAGWRLKTPQRGPRATRWSSLHPAARRHTRAEQNYRRVAATVRSCRARILRAH